MEASVETENSKKKTSLVITSQITLTNFLVVKHYWSRLETVSVDKIILCINLIKYLGNCNFIEIEVPYAFIVQINRSTASNRTRQFSLAVCLARRFTRQTCLSTTMIYTETRGKTGRKVKNKNLEYNGSVVRRITWKITNEREPRVQRGLSNRNWKDSRLLELKYFLGLKKRATARRWTNDIRKLVFSRRAWPGGVEHRIDDVLFFQFILFLDYFTASNWSACVAATGGFL